VVGFGVGGLGRGGPGESLEQATHPQLRHSRSSTHDHEAVVVVEMPVRAGIFWRRRPRASLARTCPSRSPATSALRIAKGRLVSEVVGASAAPTGVGRRHRASAQTGQGGSIQGHVSNTVLNSQAVCEQLRGEQQLLPVPGLPRRIPDAPRLSDRARRGRRACVTALKFFFDGNYSSRSRSSRRPTAHPPRRTSRPRANRHCPSTASCTSSPTTSVTATASMPESTGAATPRRRSSSARPSR